MYSVKIENHVDDKIAWGIGGWCPSLCTDNTLPSTLGLNIY